MRDAWHALAGRAPGLRGLCYVLAVTEERHFGRAARRLDMAREPLVRAVSAIEDELGTVLFDRTGRELTPTAAARALADHARTVLAGLDSPVGDAARARDPQRALRIGAVPYLGMESVRLFVAALHERHRDLATQVSHALTAEQLRRLRAGELDVAIVPFAGGEAGLAAEPLFAGDAMAAFIPIRHRLSAKRVLVPADLRDENLVMFPRSYSPALYDWWLARIEIAGYRFRSVRTAGGSDPQDLVASVAGGLGVVLASSAFVETPGVGRVVAPRSLDPPLSVPDTAVAWLADQPRELRTVLTAVRGAARDLRRHGASRWFLGEPGEPGLTARELEVLQLAAHGLSARQIAERLIVSPGTVRSHLENIYSKLGLTDRASAVATAPRRGLIECTPGDDREKLADRRGASLLRPTTCVHGPVDQPFAGGSPPGPIAS